MRLAGIVVAFGLLLIALAVPQAYSQTYTTRDDLPKNAPFKMPPDSPFKRASPEALVPAPVGPRNVTSAPVEAVDSGDAPEVQAVEAQDLAPPTVDTTQKTAESGTIFADDADAASKIAVLRCLNKVTAKFEELKVKVGDEVTFGRLTIQPISCRSATEDSLPEHAALLEIREDKVAAGLKNDKDAEKPNIFSGWVLASSPSLNGLEHPVYDISLVSCKSPKKPKS